MYGLKWRPSMAMVPMPIPVPSSLNFAFIPACMHGGITQRSAPCIKARAPGSNLVLAQELQFPAFRLLVPGFLNSGDAEFWRTGISRLANSGSRMALQNDGDILGEYGRFWATTGQNLVFENTRYTSGSVGGGWTANTCSEWVHP